MSRMASRSTKIGQILLVDPAARRPRRTACCGPAAAAFRLRLLDFAELHIRIGHVTHDLRPETGTRARVRLRPRRCRTGERPGREDCSLANGESTSIACTVSGRCVSPHCGRRRWRIPTCASGFITSRVVAHASQTSETTRSRSRASRSGSIPNRVARPRTGPPPYARRVAKAIRSARGTFRGSGSPRG